jgi:hypothetical protein
MKSLYALLLSILVLLSGLTIVAVYAETPSASIHSGGAAFSNGAGGATGGRYGASAGRPAGAPTAIRAADPVRALLPATGGITRIEDSDPAILYTGSWVPVTNLLFADHASNADFTQSSTPGDSASLAFTGSWVHVGFATDRFGGEAEIQIDGVSRGTVDLYTRDADNASFVFDGLGPTAHTLTIVVAGTSHPNASDVTVQVDFVDTWDGTLMPNGTYEEDNPRVWYSADWDFPAHPSASGAGYAETSSQGNSTAWFPFTGDTVTYYALATPGGGVGRLFVDGQPLATLDLYSTTPLTRTFSFRGLGAGAHVLTLRSFLAHVTLDGFGTPGIAPFYEDPVYAGIVRYEEYHPAIKYNGYDLHQRPQSWTLGSASQASAGATLSSRAMSDTIGLTFEGRWVNLGFRTRNRGGRAEVSIDGVSRGVIGLYSPGEDVRSFQYGGLITGTHTLTVTVLGQPDPPSGGSDIYLDYIDVWDGTAMPDGYVNARRSAPSSRLHFSANMMDLGHENALLGDYVGATLGNANGNLWYAFTGDAFTYLAFSRANDSSVEVYMDSALVDTVDQFYRFSQQPLAFHYTGFDDGPHVVRVHNVRSIQVDAFASNPTALTPYQPSVEWYDDTSAGASIWGGIHVPIAVGDVTGDGHIELVVASSDVDNSGTLFLYRGDGQDSGVGNPVIWSIPYNIPNGFEDVAAPAIAELDGQPGAEIIHSTVEGLYVYHSDGSTYWMTDSVKSHVFFGTPAVGNLDADPEPEIVVNLDYTLAVFEADGTLAWQTVFTDRVGMPVLADLTGDGALDILLHESGDTLYLYDYNLGNPTLAWSHVFTTPLEIYGSPAVADIDGERAGGDPGPEIAVTSDGWAHVLDADGSLIWSTALDSGRPGGTAIADLDGDGEVEIVTSMTYDGGRIYALNADGSLLWAVPAADNSPLSVSLLDLEGDGVYEVAWNGADQGFTLFNGSDGAVLFNEPDPGVISQTGSDYPVFADVDLDGYGEVVVPAQGGVRVFGFDGFWAPSRPLWNQHTYHVTNVDDDLSTPAAEPAFWEEHNTFRAQRTTAQGRRGVTLAAEEVARTGYPGKTVAYTLQITNTGDWADSFTLAHAGAQWDVVLPVTQATLGAGQSTPVSIKVAIPLGATDGQADTFTVIVTSRSDPDVSASVELNVAALGFLSSHVLYLPLVER